MKQALTRVTLSLLPLITYSNVAAGNWQSQVWQADVQIRTLEVTRTRSTMTARVVVYSEKDDEARDSQGSAGFRFFVQRRLRRPAWWRRCDP